MENKLKSGRWELANDAQYMICPCIYDHVLPYSGDYAPVCLNGKWGTVDRQGRSAVPAEYGFVCGVRGDLAVVLIERKGKPPLYRIVDANGRGNALRYMLLDDALEALEDMCGAHAAAYEADARAADGFEGAQIDGEGYTIDVRGGLLIPSLHGCSVPLGDAYFAALEKGRNYSAMDKNRWGLVDAQTHRPILPFLYEDINMVDAHLVKVKMKGKWGIADARVPAYRACASCDSVS